MRNSHHTPIIFSLEKYLKFRVKLDTENLEKPVDLENSLSQHSPLYHSLLYSISFSSFTLSQIFSEATYSRDIFILTYVYSQLWLTYF